MSFSTRMVCLVAFSFVPFGRAEDVVQCVGRISAGNLGPLHVVATQWNQPGFPAGPVDKVEDGVSAEMWGRAYFADDCSTGTYDNANYAAIPLLGKSLTYTTDLSQAGCGCNSALYLVSMRQNKNESACHDYYCDANAVCGVKCHEIDIQEANRYAWHSTLHAEYDGVGVTTGYGGFGYPSYAWDVSEYGPGGKCVDTNYPFEVTAAFPEKSRGVLAAMNVTLSQSGKSCVLSLILDKYANDPSFKLLSKALHDGMTPVLSYWKSTEMLWLDGLGGNRSGPCKEDTELCGQATQFYNFSVEDLPTSGVSPHGLAAIALLAVVGLDAR